MIYLDYAATSWPKPPEVMQVMHDFLEHDGGNPGRSGHRLSIQAARHIYNTREALAELLHLPDPLRIIFTLNATHALNLAMQGILRRGEAVIASSFEHNAVMRPLHWLEKNRRVRVKIIPGQPDGSLQLDDLRAVMTSETRLVVVQHANNVTGTLMPIAQIAELVHRFGALLLVDAAQTIGAVNIDMSALGIDLLAFTGHKALLGPPGVGGLAIGNGVEEHLLEPLVCGGTGSRSESETQPEDLPDKYESGTPNGVGIAGLGAGARWVLDRGVTAIQKQELALRKAILNGLLSIPGVNVYGPLDAAIPTIAVVSFTLAGRRVSEVGLRLDEEFDVLCRVGLHCAPATHRTLGTFPEGTIRFSPGVFTSLTDIQVAIESIKKIVAS